MSTHHASHLPLDAWLPFGFRQKEALLKVWEEGEGTWFCLASVSILQYSDSLVLAMPSTCHLLPRGGNASHLVSPETWDLLWRTFLWDINTYRQEILPWAPPNSSIISPLPFPPQHWGMKLLLFTLLIFRILTSFFFLSSTSIFLLFLGPYHLQDQYPILNFPPFEIPSAIYVFLTKSQPIHPHFIDEKSKSARKFRFCTSSHYSN